MIARMNRIALSLTLLVLSTAATSTGALAAPRQTLRPTANPGAVIAAEIGFAALAQEKGQWTAFRQTAAKGAKMFAPQPVLVDTFLKGRQDPPVAVKWQPHIAWSSCDGSIAVTRGAWQRPDSVGYFVTVWQRQKDGNYKWVLDQGDALTQPLAEPDAIDGVVADCPAPGHRGDHKDDLRDAKGKLLTGPQLFADPLSAAANDGSLTWTTTVDTAGARDFTLHLRKDGAMRVVLHVAVKAPGRG